MEDNKIIDLFLARDEEAIKQTSIKYDKSLRKIAYNICGNKLDSEECVNDTYLSAWNSIPPNEPREYFFAYLAKITRDRAINIVKNLSRQKRKAEFIELSQELENCLSSGNNAEEIINAKELSKTVSDFLRTVKEDKRNIFIRRYFFMDSVSEIAERFNISESKVKTTLSRLRKELKSYLSEKGWNV